MPLPRARVRLASSTVPAATRMGRPTAPDGRLTGSTLTAGEPAAACTSVR
ncbi:MAG TPA: hypothetical protein VGM53_29995 [Streptosporangiaceae bacterium]